MEELPEEILGLILGFTSDECTLPIIMVCVRWKLVMEWMKRGVRFSGRKERKLSWRVGSHVRKWVITDRTDKDTLYTVNRKHGYFTFSLKTLRKEGRGLETVTLYDSTMMIGDTMLVINKMKRKAEGLHDARTMISYNAYIMENEWIHVTPGKEGMWLDQCFPRETYDNWFKGQTFLYTHTKVNWLDFVYAKEFREGFRKLRRYLDGMQKCFLPSF